MTSKTTPIRLPRIETTDAIVRAAAARFKRIIGVMVKRLAQGDAELRQDLEQEALIALWDLDPTRFDAEDVPYIRRELWERMRTYARLERRRAGGGKRSQDR